MEGMWLNKDMGEEWNHRLWTGRLFGVNYFVIKSTRSLSLLSKVASYAPKKGALGSTRRDVTSQRRTQTLSLRVSLCVYFPWATRYRLILYCVCTPIRSHRKIGREWNLDFAEVSTLVNRHRSKLSLMLNRYNVCRWSSKLGLPDKPNTPSGTVARDALSTYLSGDQCDQCKKKRSLLPVGAISIVTIIRIRRIPKNLSPQLEIPTTESVSQEAQDFPAIGFAQIWRNGHFPGSGFRVSDADFRSI